MEMNRQEERDRRAAARAFADALSSDDPMALREVSEHMGWVIDCWAAAMRAALRNSAVTETGRNAFQNLWIEHKGLPRSVGSRPLMAKALRHLLPSPRPLPGLLTVYRGTTLYERRRRLYGFSWSTSREIARGFPERWGKTPFGGLVLSTELSPDAVLLDRQDDDYYAERELVDDPYRLGRVKVVERLGPSERLGAQRA